MDVFADELYEVLPRANWSRRGFLVTSLATGFALAAGPISAETITTDWAAAGLVDTILS
jgi:carboxymethylenebutenolidase